MYYDTRWQGSVTIVILLTKINAGTIFLEIEETSVLLMLLRIIEKPFHQPEYDQLPDP